jgi:hypothetical protein
VEVAREEFEELAARVAALEEILHRVSEGARTQLEEIEAQLRRLEEKA